MVRPGETPSLKDVWYYNIYLSKLRRDSVVTSESKLRPIIYLQSVVFISFPDLAKVHLAKALAAFGKTFVRRPSTRFGFLLVPRGVIWPIYTCLSKLRLLSLNPLVLAPSYR